jgi:hypothetical protein
MPVSKLQHYSIDSNRFHFAAQRKLLKKTALIKIFSGPYVKISPLNCLIFKDCKTDGECSANHRKSLF